MTFSVPYCRDLAWDCATTTFSALDEIRHDMTAFKKSCLIILSIIQGINFYRHTNYLSSLTHVLDYAPSFEFYGFCRLPHYFLFYLPEQIDEQALLDDLETVLCGNWNLGALDESEKLRDPAIHARAKQELTHLLEAISEGDEAFASIEEVRKVTAKFLQESLAVQNTLGVDPNAIDLKDLTVTFKRSSFIKKISEITFVLVDMACFPSFLQGWSLVDLSSLGSVIGRIPLFSRAAGLFCLDDWIWAGTCIGDTLDAGRFGWSLLFQKLKPDQKKRNQWGLVVAITDFVYSFLILQKSDPRIIVACGLIAHSTSLASFFFSPKTVFFELEAT